MRQTKATYVPLIIDSLTRHAWGQGLPLVNWLKPIRSCLFEKTAKLISCQRWPMARGGNLGHRKFAPWNTRTGWLLVFLKTIDDDVDDGQESRREPFLGHIRIYLWAYNQPTLAKKGLHPDLCALRLRGEEWALMESLCYLNLQYQTSCSWVGK